MPYSDDDHLLAELRRLLADVDPVPAPVQAAAYAALRGARILSPGEGSSA